MAIFHSEPDSSVSTRRSLTGARWRVVPPVAGVLDGVHPALGQVLAARGVATPAARDAFLHADLATLHDPLLLPDMPEAVAALQDALARGARIRIFGDYDADGINATALLVRALKALGGQVDWYLPHRVEDGYGLNRAALEEALADGVDLGITVDNGISAHEQLTFARERGLAMIVTDHHEPGEVLPPALAVIDPKRADCVYPFRELAGVGVAYMLLRALCAARGLPESAPAKFLDLVAIGTVADVAPLTGENRVLVRHGLPLLTPGNKKLGIAALLRAVRIEGCASSGDIAFLLGPRLNAAGRVAHAAAALELLLTGDPTEAATLAAQLCEQNAQRQEEEARTLESALAQVAAADLDREKVLLLASPDWHPGIIGIVASRIVERVHRPTALVAVQDGVGKGSARARAPFHLWEALHRCQALLTRFGGHQVAAGFEVPEANIPALRDALNAVADEMLTDDDLLPMVAIDAVLELADVTTVFARDVEALAPFGVGNPTPVFAISDLRVVQTARRGADGAHLSLTLRPADGGRPINAMWFRRGEQEPNLPTGAVVDAAFTVELNCWQNIVTPRLVIKDILV
jgi:single-stranded-DNA-specific exonuclease